MPKMGRKRVVEADEILHFMETESDDARKPWTAPEMAEIMGYSSDTILSRLKELEEIGLVKSMVVGPRGLVWWIPGERAGKSNTYTVPLLDLDTGEEMDVTVSADSAREAMNLAQQITAFAEPCVMEPFISEHFSGVL